MTLWVILLIMLGWAANGAAATFYVDIHGDNANDGITAPLAKLSAMSGSQNSTCSFMSPKLCRVRIEPLPGSHCRLPSSCGFHLPPCQAEVSGAWPGAKGNSTTVFLARCVECSPSAAARSLPSVCLLGKILR